jgi:hypothetical protein
LSVAPTFLTAVLTLLGVALWLPCEARAQWTQPNASNNINNTNTGNVGVGTTAPVTIFQIRPAANVNMGFTHSGGTEAIITAFNDANTATVPLVLRGTSIKFQDGTLTERFRISSGVAFGSGFVGLTAPANGAIFQGDVGIGTAAPQATLHVSTSSIATGSRGIIDEQTSNDANGALLIVRKSRAGAAVQNGDSLGNLYASGFDGTGWLSGARIRFGVDGAVSAGVMPTNMQFITGTNNSTVERMRITSAGNIGIGTAAPNALYKLDVAGSVNASGLCLGGACKTNWSEVGGTSQWANGASGSISYGAGNVGVATATPGARFDVGAGAASRGSYTDLLIGGGGNNPQMEFYGATKSSAIAHDEPMGGLVFYTNGPVFSPSLFVGNSSNVGVGTTAPAVKLAVGGAGINVYNTDLWAENNIHVQGNEVMTQGGGRGRLRVGAAWGYMGLFAENSSANVANDLVLGAGTGFVRVGPNASAGGPAMNFVVPNGRVGIGTAAPNALYKLDVAGSINASGLCLGGACKTNWSEVGGTSQWDNGASGAISYGAGNVGVGVAAPAAKLHVAGGARLEGAGRVYVGTTAAQGARGLEFIEENATTFSIRHHDPNVAWQNIAINPFGGNLGVGTTTPRGKLEVAGGPLFLGDMGNTSWGNVIVRGRVTSTNGNLHLSPPGGMGVYIDSSYREAGGAGGPVNLHVSGDVVVGGNISAKYQDVAEWVPTTQKLSAGTVVVLDAGRTNHVLASGTSYDTSVAGVVSAEPGLILGVAGDDKVKVATTGRVKVKVDATRGAIKVGDLLVTSDVEGLAMKSVPVELGGVRIHRPGTIIGKALEPLPKGVGEILVLLSLQ